MFHYVLPTGQVFIDTYGKKLSHWHTHDLRTLLKYAISSIIILTKNVVRTCWKWSILFMLHLTRLFLTPQIKWSPCLCLVKKKVDDYPQKMWAKCISDHFPPCLNAAFEVTWKTKVLITLKNIENFGAASEYHTNLVHTERIPIEYYAEEFTQLVGTTCIYVRETRVQQFLANWVHSISSSSVLEHDFTYRCSMSCPSLRCSILHITCKDACVDHKCRR